MPTPSAGREAIGIGLPVNNEGDRHLEELMWSVWLDIEKELEERQPFDPIAVLLNSDQGGTLLGLDENDDAKPINAQPVDFALVDAIMESCRLAFRGETKGKILASRQPDLNIQFNSLVTYKHPARGWSV